MGLILEENLSRATVCFVDRRSGTTTDLARLLQAKHRKRCLHNLINEILKIKRTIKRLKKIILKAGELLPKIGQGKNYNEVYVESH